MPRQETGLLGRVKASLGLKVQLLLVAYRGQPDT